MAASAGVALDTADTRQYIQKHRLWLVAEYLSKELMERHVSNTKDKDVPVYDFIIEKLDAIKKKGPPEALDAPPSDLSGNSKAKEYAAKSGIADAMEQWLRACLELKPAMPFEFSEAYFTHRKEGQTHAEAARNAAQANHALAAKEAPAADADAAAKPAAEDEAMAAL